MRIATCLAVSAFIATSTAQASIVSYNFTATIVKMYELNAAANTITEVNQSSFPGFVVDSTWAISGTYQYDMLAPLSTDYQPQVPANGQHMAYQSATPSSGLSYAFSGDRSPFRSSDALRLEVGNDASSLMGWDVFYTSGRMTLDNSMFQEVTLSLYDQTATAFSGAAIPSSLDINAFHLNRLNTLFARSDGNTLTVEAVVTVWERLEPFAVPEPSALYLSAAGLFCILGLRVARNETTRRQKRGAS